MEYIPAPEVADKRVKNASQTISAEEVVSLYGTYIYNIALKLSGKPEMAEDIAQETFIKVWKHIDQLKDQNAIKKWLHTICVNEFKMLMKKEGREKAIYVENIEELINDGELLISTSESVTDEIQATEEVIYLRPGFFLGIERKLSVNQRIVFSLSDMFGLSINEIADIIDITPKAAKGLLYRARMNLDSFFQEHCMFLDTKNPCNCAAWIEFFQQRDELRNSIHNKSLDYKEKGYSFDIDVQNKVAYYYQQIPDQTPCLEWYQRVMELLEK